MRSDLEITILRTVSYFAYFSYPLTAFEIWKWQLEPVRAYALEDIMNALGHSSFLGRFLAREDGFFSLAPASISELVIERHARYQNAIEKYRKLKCVLAYLRRIPSIEAVAICNSLAMHHTQERSDIDLFVVTQPGTVWKTRLHAVLPLALLRQRPGEARRNPVDVSFFVSQDNANMRELRIGSKDPYLAYWLANLGPVFERRHGIIAQLVQANDWIRESLPCAELPQRSRARYVSGGIGFSAPIPERVAQWIQRRKFPADIKALANKDSRVIVNAGMLKFHKNDRRAEIAAALEKRMRYVE